VVDDDSTALVVMTRILSRAGTLRRLFFFNCRKLMWPAGAEVRGYLLPRELLSAIKSEPNWADIVLSDVSMPDIDGFGVLSTVEKTVPRLRGKIIAATAHASELDLKRITAAGFVACLTKPLRAPMVVSTISQVLAKIVSPSHT
jgi:CheY-like chemotaxis protein